MKKCILTLAVLSVLTPGSLTAQWSDDYDEEHSGCDYQALSCIAQAAASHQQCRKDAETDTELYSCDANYYNELEHCPDSGS